MDLKPTEIKNQLKTFFEEKLDSKSAAVFTHFVSEALVSSNDAVTICENNPEIFRNNINMKLPDGHNLLTFTLKYFVPDKNVTYDNLEDKISILNHLIDAGAETHKPYKLSGLMSDGENEPRKKVPLIEVIKIIPPYEMNLPLSPEFVSLVEKIIKKNEEISNDANNMQDDLGRNAAHILSLKTNEYRFHTGCNNYEPKIFDYSRNTEKLLQLLHYAGVDFDQNSNVGTKPNKYLENYFAKVEGNYDPKETSFLKRDGINNLYQVLKDTDLDKTSKKTAGDLRFKHSINDTLGGQIRALTDNLPEHSTNFKADSKNKTFKDIRSKYYNQYFKPLAGISSEANVRGVEDVSNISQKAMDEAFINITKLYSDKSTKRAEVIYKNSGTKTDNREDDLADFRSGLIILSYAPDVKTDDSYSSSMNNRLKTHASDMQLVKSALNGLYEFGARLDGIDDLTKQPFKKLLVASPELDETGGGFYNNLKVNCAERAKQLIEDIDERVDYIMEPTNEPELPPAEAVKIAEGLNVHKQAIQTLLSHDILKSVNQGKGGR